MNTVLERRTLKCGAWSGLVFMVLFGTGWVGIAGWFPPPPPTLTPDDVAHMYQVGYIKIRVGLLFMMVSTLFLIPFTGALTSLLSRIEGKFGVLSACVLGGGLILTVFTFYPAIWWFTAAYRPDRSADLIYLLNDWAWLEFVGAEMPAIPLWIALAVATFAETGEDRIFPRWYGYYNAWLVISSLPSQLLFFVKTGPFAWNGVLALYLPAIVFFGWFFPTMNFIIKAANKTR